MAVRDPARLIASQLEGIRLAANRMRKPGIGKLVDMILRAKSVFITGQGRSGLIAQCLATRLAQMGMSVNVPGYANCRKIRRTDLLLAVSCSGTTRTTVELARISREHRAKVAVVTAVPDSPLAKLADHVVVISSNDPKVRAACSCVVGPMNNTLFEQLLLLIADTLVCMLLDAKGAPAGTIGRQHTNLE